MKRKTRRRRTYHRKSDMKIKVFSAVMAVFFSVGAGYVTATYIIGPALGLDAQPMFSDFLKKESVEEEKKNNKNENENVKIVQDELPVNTESGYALQYGSFSSKEGAQTCVDKLSGMGITAEIIEKDNCYKVIGEVFETKSEAEKSKQQVPVTEDVFITEIP